MNSRYDNSLIQYYEVELERAAPRGAESDNLYLPVIGEMVLLLTEKSEVLEDGSKHSESWFDHDADAQRMVYFHQLTGWATLLTWNGYHGVEGHRLEYFNPVHKNPGFVRTRDFGGSMDVVSTYQTWAMDVEKPFWDLYSAIVEREEELPKIDQLGFSRIVEQLEVGIASLL